MHSSTPPGQWPGFDTTTAAAAAATSHLPPQTPPEDIPEDISMSEVESLSMPSTSQEVSTLQSQDMNFPVQLPPHLEARFRTTRPSLSSRRKQSSTASSRRSSLTSHHSNRSSTYTGCSVQSAHVAQHLRRMSILEERRARLADKAAHAEKVRLRAALAKAAPRLSGAASEERAAAARAARERYLAQVAASCAEEVKRSKRVAGEMKEKREAELEKLRGEVARREVEAEKRRVAYLGGLRRARGMIGGSPDRVVEEEKTTVNLRPWKPANEETATRYIQNTWRRTKRREVFKQFLALELIGPGEEGSSRRTFEDLTLLISTPNVLEKTGNVLKIFGLVDLEDKSSAGPTAPKLLLSSLLITDQAKHVFTQEGEIERELKARAQRLQRALYAVLHDNPVSIEFRAPKARLATLMAAFGNFKAAFTAWKQDDGEPLVETMIAQFVELDAIWQTVKKDTAGGAAAEYRVGVQNNQTLLLVRLKRLLGQDKAMEKIREALLERRRHAKSVKRSAAGKRPARDVTNDVTRVAPSASPAITSSASNDTAAPVSAISQAMHLRQLLSLSDPLPDNRTITHELAVDRTWSIQPSPRTPAWDTAMRTIFHTMQTNLEAGRPDPTILYVAENIRMQLLRMIPPGKPQYILISETLDPQHIERQLQHGTFSYDRFFAFMNGVLPKLCAPARDGDVRAFVSNKENENVTERMLRLIQIIRALGIDYANFLIQSSAVELLRHAAEYEQRAFTQMYGPSQQQLLRTRIWWQAAKARAIADAARRPESPSRGNTLPPSLPSADKIYSEGLAELFISPFVLSQAQVAIPETLALDTSRIERTRYEVRRVVAISTILLTAKNLLKRDVRMVWKSEYGRLMEMFSQPLAPDASACLSAIESSHALPPSTRSQLLGTIERILKETRATTAITSAPESEASASTATSTSVITHPVLKVLFSKLRSHVLVRISASSADERTRLAKEASEALTRAGLVESVGWVKDVVDAITRVKIVDWEAHGSWLEKIAGEN
ncbi:hypothetical protein MMC25_001051 [Agyrium rufum]|nr:hypothetical protein [Agyrium rufum]